ncbi:MAG TPA: hypothetical protein VGF76_23200, partial [Polyangiaceae bacterium]
MPPVGNAAAIGESEPSAARKKPNTWLASAAFDIVYTPACGGVGGTITVPEPAAPASPVSPAAPGSPALPAVSLPAPATLIVPPPCPAPALCTPPAAAAPLIPPLPAELVESSPSLLQATIAVIANGTDKNIPGMLLRMVVPRQVENAGQPLAESQRVTAGPTLL